MATTEVCQLGDIGTAFQVTVTDQNGNVVDVSSASAKQIILQKPDGSDIVGTASFVTNGTDGQIQYLSQAGDLDQVGRWQVQGYVVLGGGSWHTATGVFKVKANLN